MNSIMIHIGMIFIPFILPICEFPFPSSLSFYSVKMPYQNVYCILNVIYYVLIMLFVGFYSCDAYSIMLLFYEGQHFDLCLFHCYVLVRASSWVQ